MVEMVGRKMFPSADFSLEGQMGAATGFLIGPLGKGGGYGGVSSNPNFQRMNFLC